MANVRALAPCPSCRRHVRVADAGSPCPFCGAALPATLDAARPFIPRNASRAAAIAIVAGLAAGASVAACSSSSEPGPAADSGVGDAPSDAADAADTADTGQDTGVDWGGGVLYGAPPNDARFV